MSSTAGTSSAQRPSKRTNVSRQIITGLLAGVAVGLFFGEMVAGLQVVGDVFIKLLQMTVLPYILVSLIAGLGKLDAATARLLAVRGTTVLLVIWALALALVFSAQLAFPERDTASFFSFAFLETRPEADILERFIPANIFYSLTHNLVPAVVLFSVLLGAALISLEYEKKSELLQMLDGTSAALASVNHFVIRLTPIGVFAIAASAAGTMTIDELERIQVYLITYVAVALTVTFWVFPGLVTAVTGIRFREVLQTYKDALITAFATGNQFVVLPQIAEETKALMQRHGLRSEQTDSAVDVLVPVSFNFPSLGKLLVLLFVLFSAWFTDTSISAADQLGLAVNGVLTLFGNINIAVPYLLDSLQVPADMFQLFVLTGIAVGRAGAMLAALHIIVLGIIGTLAIGGQLRITAASVLRYLLITALVTVIMIAVLRLYFEHFVPNEHRRDDVLAQMHQMEERVDTTLRDDLRPIKADAPVVGERLAAIHRRGALRIGYRPDTMPCSFVNGAGDLVGMDIELMHILAEDMGVALRLYPVTNENFVEALNTARVDVVIGCLAATPGRLRNLDLSKSYLDLTLAFIVPDHRRGDFSALASVESMDSVRIAMHREGYFANRVRRFLPNAEVVIVDSVSDFLENQETVADAMLNTAEIGAAYSLMYPRFSVAVPVPRIVKVPVAFALPKGATRLTNTVDAWLELQEKNGTLDTLFDYWMLGGAAKVSKPRWSVIRDVLHWVD